MLQEINKLIVGIVHLSVGITIILFWKKITKALLKSTYTFWGELGGRGKKIGIIGGEKFAYFMILLIGILFLLSGSYVIYQFFSPYLVSYIKKDVRMSQLFLDNHLGKLREKIIMQLIMMILVTKQKSFLFSKISPITKVY